MLQLTKGQCNFKHRALSILALGRELGAPGTARARGWAYTGWGEAMLGGASGREHRAPRQVPGEAVP